MQLAGPLPQEFDLFRIHAAYQFLEENAGQRCFTLKIAFTLQHAIIITAEGVHRECPDVPFIGYRALQEANNSRLRLWPTGGSRGNNPAEVCANMVRAGILAPRADRLC